MMQSVAEMRHARRVLIVAAPSATDPQRVAQERALHSAGEALADRDVTVVAVTGDHVAGATDGAGVLRQRWHLPPEAFTVFLIGKDGHEALRRTTPIDSATLTAAIDAMPMRRAGQR
jgi:hypothetical protein